MVTWIDCPRCESHAMRGPDSEAWCTQDDCTERSEVAVRVSGEETAAAKVPD
jgi:hypothetical protein